MAKITRNADNEQRRSERRRAKDEGVAAVAEREPQTGNTDLRPPVEEGQAATSLSAASLAPEPPNSPAGEAPSSDAIARRAFELYQQRGGGEGQEIQDWLRAEEELGRGGQRQS